MPLTLVALAAAFAGLVAGVAVTLVVLRSRLAAAEVDREALGRAREQVARLEAQLAGERAQAKERLALVESARVAMREQLELAAMRVVDEKARELGEENRGQLAAVLDPLRAQLGEFKRRLDEVHDGDVKDRSTLLEQVRQLAAMNQQLSQGANRLAEALRGSSQTRGHWGELVLERLLEAAGLRRGHEYDVQESHRDDEGRRLQPDLVLHLPEGRQLVVDSKVTLVAYEAFVAATDDDARRRALREHLDAVRGHVKGLSSKNYEQLHGRDAVDFVVMFVPVEPAFTLALAEDLELWRFAWERRVLLVGPSTLLFVLRTVAQLLREAQAERHAQEIAKRGAELYDKLSAFVGELDKVGEKLRQASEAFVGARRRLVEGRGNVVRQAERLRELGVKPTKPLPADLVDAAQDEDERALG